MRPRSTLTRSVFRALAADRPYTFTECRRVIPSSSGWRMNRAQELQTQRRSIFGISIASTARSLVNAKSTPRNLEAAWGQLVALVRAQRTQSRPPAQEQIADAVRLLFRSHLESPHRFSRTEIYLATEAFNHLQELTRTQPDEAEPLLSKDDLTSALLSLATGSGKDRYRSDIGALASDIFDELQKSHDEHRTAPSGDTAPLEGSTLATYVEVLSSTGRAREARDLLWKSPEAQQRQYIPAWVTVVKGLFNEGLEKEAWRTMEQVQDSIGLLSSSDQQSLVAFLADSDNLLSAKKAHELKLESGSSPTIPCRTALVRLCVRRKDFSWGDTVVKSLIASKEDGDVVDIVLLWHVAQDVSSSSVISALRNGLEALGLSRSSLTMSNLNVLVEYAYLVRAPESARILMDFASQTNLRPDTKTFLAQLAYQIEVGDLPAAKATYELLASEDRILDGSDVPVLNRFLAALCFSPRPEMDTVMRVTDGLLDQGADLDAETMAGLCHVFLHRDEADEAAGLLRHRADSYPAPDRARIGAVFQEFILDLNVQDQRAFNAYELFRQAFSETPVDQRLVLMNAFFDRNRSDLACLVFGHMRQREDLEARPTAAAYAQCFEGVARCRDVDGLQMVYNMLKMDREVASTTRIHNALMLAYTACQMPFTAIIDHYWKILDSREGPTLSTFALALRACETWVPQGSQEARRIIALMQRWGFQITKEIYHCYIGALAGQSEFENTVELIEEMEHDIGERPDVITIGSFYNAIPWQFRKDEVEAWAKKAYPDLWEELVSYGDEIDEEWEIRIFKIDRSIDMNDDLIFGDGEYNPEITRTTLTKLEAPGG